MRLDRSYQQVKNNPGLYRDPSNGAIVNVNKEQINRARNAKKARLKQHEEFETVKQDVNQMKSDISDIKLLLQRLADK